MPDRLPCHLFEWDSDAQEEPLGACVTLCGIKSYGAMGKHVLGYRHRVESEHTCQTCVERYPLYELKWQKL